MALVWLAAAAPARAQAKLDAAVLKRVKSATAHLEVQLPDGNAIEGSGFFTDEPGLVITNAHVLGMLDPDARRPVRVRVTVHSGESDSRTLPGKLLGVDRGSDLAVLRVEGKDLPEPLTVAAADGLTETQDVYILGFPLGRQLGKNITISTSSVSSLRKVNGVLRQIQVNGGMHPGNSGGPVTDAQGRVIGVAVAGIRGTQINFAIPGEVVRAFLNGKVVTLNVNLPYKDGAAVKMPTNLTVVDPLGRVKKVWVDTWTGDPGQRRPGGTAEPPAQPGDSPKTTTPVNYTKAPLASVDLPLPAREGAKKVYWVRPAWTDGVGQTHYFAAIVPPFGAPVERKEVTLGYKPKPGRQQVLLTSGGDFKLRLPGEESSLTLNLRTTITETVAAAEGERIPLRLGYRAFSLGLKVDNKPVTGDADLRRWVNDIRFLGADVEMDADGTLARAKPDLARVPKGSRQALEEISDQVLQSLELLSVPLPNGTLRPLQTWKAQRNVLIGSVVVGVPAQADIKYTYLGVRPRDDGRPIAFLNLSGPVRGRRGDGLNVGGTVDGGAQVALDTGEVLSAAVNIKSDMDLVYERKKAKALGTLRVEIRRGDVPAPKPTPAKP